MNTDLENIRGKRISLISALSFSFCLCSMGIMAFNIINLVLELVEVQNTTIILGIVLLLFVITSIVLGIIDVCLKNRKKVLSIISLSISGFFFGIYIIILLLLTLYTSAAL